MLDILMRGGFMMIPILLGSVLALAIIIERFWSLQRTKVFPEGFLVRMDEMMKSSRKAEALSACRENESAISRILEAGVQSGDRPRTEIREALQVAGRSEAMLLNRWVGTLGAVAALEPLMGLLGTVLGLIESFRDLSTSTVVGDPSVVASGVWQALITTAAGLIIAIPTFAMYRYFRARVSLLVMDMEQSAFSLLQQLSQPQQQQPEAGDQT